MATLQPHRGGKEDAAGAGEKPGRGPRGTTGWARGPGRGLRGRGLGEGERRRRTGGEGGGAGLFLNSASTRSLALWFLRVVYSIFLFLRRPSPVRLRVEAQGLVGSGSARASLAWRRAPWASESRRRLDGPTAAALPDAEPAREVLTRRMPSLFRIPLVYKARRHFLIETTKFTECDCHFEGPHLGPEPKPLLCWESISVCSPRFRTLAFSPPSSFSFPLRVMRTTGLIA
ncbi:uncharacterized protein LOC115803173 [Delphinapterus leucas]|uniref:Uncharacterized protein LOC115803173 n=1 Tax=Delphinapterus leucas TaxID=9749 RepID=A0A7F8KA14_DELLE|nr:uncharacterized protein LOC115803173 [Delphinapterus leucas]